MLERSSFTATRHASLDWVVTRTALVRSRVLWGGFWGGAGQPYRDEGRVCWDCRGPVSVSDLSQPAVSAVEPITDCLS